MVIQEATSPFAHLIHSHQEVALVARWPPEVEEEGEEFHLFPKLLPVILHVESLALAAEAVEEQAKRPEL